MNKKIIIYTDGGARGNPGIAGAGAFITDGEGNCVKEVHRALGVRTNNWAEYEAVVLGFETLKKLFKKEDLKKLEIEIRMDSELVQRQLTGKYRVKDADLKLQFAKLKEVIGCDFSPIKFTHIRREENKEADRLSNEAMDSQEK